MKNSCFFILVILLAGCNINPSSNEASIDQKAGMASWFKSLVSSKPKEVGPLEYMEYVNEENNGLYKKKVVGNYQYSVQYKPLDYEALRNLSLETLNASNMDSMRHLISDMQYFTFSIANVNGGNDFIKSTTNNYGEYQQLLNYLSNDIYKDFLLVSGEDTLSCLMHHFERTFSISPDAKIVLAFGLPKGKKSNDFEDKTFVFTDRIFKTGIIKMKISAEAIKNCPSITFSSDETI